MKNKFLMFGGVVLVVLGYSSICYAPPPIQPKMEAPGTKEEEGREEREVPAPPGAPERPSEARPGEKLRKPVRLRMPDLIVSIDSIGTPQLQSPDRDPRTGQIIENPYSEIHVSIPCTITVRNKGTALVRRVGFCIESRTEFGALGFEAPGLITPGCPTFDGTLAPGSSRTFTGNLFFVEILSEYRRRYEGTRARFRALVDPLEDITELEETNNYSEWSSAVTFPRAETTTEGRK